MRYVLIGNFGVGNAGDELLREYFVTRFPEIQWTIVSGNPRAGEVPRLPTGLRSFLRTRWWRTIAAIRMSDGIVFGGGSLFTDTESVKACVLWGLHAFVAWVLGKNIFLAFQGIGPLHSGLARRIARWVVSRSIFISVRDAESEKRVQEFGRTDVVLTADPVPLLFPEKGNRPAGNVLVLLPRHNSGKLLTEACSRALENVPHTALRIVSMQPDREEMNTCAMLATHFGISDIRPVTGMTDIQEALADASYLVTERYHGALAGFCLGIPLLIVSQKKGDKLDAFSAQMQQGLTPAQLRSSARFGEEELRRALGK